MRLNYETVLSGGKTILCPYRPEHVEKYHEWMKSPFLLDMTGSEPLSLEEEIQMQQSWRDDEEKCTFILLHKELCESHLMSGPDAHDFDEAKAKNGNTLLRNEFIISTLDAMVGDVNMFLSEEEDDDDDGGNGTRSDELKNGDDRPAELKQAELDLMVAEERYRGRGIGKEAACMMMLYGAENLGIRKFTVKIKKENTASRYLFENSLSFEEINYAACFEEYEYVFKRESPAETAAAVRKLYGQQVDHWRIA